MNIPKRAELIKRPDGYYYWHWYVGRVVRDDYRGPHKEFFPVWAFDPTHPANIRKKKKHERT
jgi:hypothetical protein